MNTFIQVLLELTEVLTVLQCSLKSPYTNSKIYSLHNIFPVASRFLHHTGLPTHRSAYRFTYSASPIGPNRSDRCWACLSTLPLKLNLRLLGIFRLMALGPPGSTPHSRSSTFSNSILEIYIMFYTCLCSMNTFYTSSRRTDRGTHNTSMLIKELLH